MSSTLSFVLLAAAAGMCCLLPCTDARGSCYPNPCKNGARCRALSFDHVCLNCDRRRFGTGRDCESAENDAGPWAAWGACNVANGFQRRERECVKPFYFYQLGEYRCKPTLRLTRECAARRQPQVPVPSNPPQQPPTEAVEPAEERPQTPEERPQATTPPSGRQSGGGRCYPNPCRNGARCRARSFDHVCLNCDRRRFGTGRDCESAENDAGPWAAWGACNAANGFQRRERECVKPFYFYQLGEYRCKPTLRQTRECAARRQPQVPVTSNPPQQPPTEAVEPAEERPQTTAPPRRQSGGPFIPGFAGGRCYPNPCRNGARCRARSFDHVCLNCDRRRFGTGRDCESVENDVGPWGAWQPCRPGSGQRRRRTCLKPFYFYRRGFYTCKAPVSELRLCTAERSRSAAAR